MIWKNDMTAILVLTREDLNINSKLKEIDKIELCDFGTFDGEKEKYLQSDLIIFYCLMLKL